MNKQLSCTSNNVKLFKHMRKLHGIQSGTISPIMVHIAPTNRCQLNCVHCCFANRTKDMELTYSEFTSAVCSFISIGTTAFEFTGGGDPLLWPHINAASKFLSSMDMNQGLITNGIGISNVDSWDKFDWVRVSLNTLEYNSDKLNVDPLIGKTDVSFCYIWHEGSKPHLQKVADMAERYKVPCRVTIDCTGKDIDAYVKQCQEELAAYSNEYLFFSGFNIDTEKREKWDCRMHMIKPFLFADGYLYSCPSAELAEENNRMVHDGIRVCHHTNITDFYRSYAAAAPQERTCSYCKYAQQQRVLSDLQTPTKHNAFA